MKGVCDRKCRDLDIIIQIQTFFPCNNIENQHLLTLNTVNIAWLYERGIFKLVETQLNTSISLVKLNNNDWFKILCPFVTSDDSVVGVFNSQFHSKIITLNRYKYNLHLNKTVSLHFSTSYHVFHPTLIISYGQQLVGAAQ